MYNPGNSVSKNRIKLYLTLCILEIPKWVLWQTVKALIKCHRNAAFHQGLHCLLRQNESSEKEIKYCFKIMACGPSMYTMDHPAICVCTCSFMENSMSLIRVKQRISFLRYIFKK